MVQLEMNLWIEIMHIFVQQSEQPPEQEQLNNDRFTADGVTVMEQQEEIIAESREHGDLVQGSFLDTYRNLTYKSVMGHVWVR